MARRRLIDRLPVVHQLRQSVGLQRGMLVAGLVLTGVFVLCALSRRGSPRTATAS
jgi:peptide/nickel transport system permease protein